MAGTADRRQAPAYYAVGRGRAGDWWTLLHPPYTAWHLSYVLLGAATAPTVRVPELAATLLAFFLAVGIAAHALDELQGRPLRTTIPDRGLVVAATLALTGAVALGAAGVVRVGWGLVGFIVVGTLLVLAYNLEWFGGTVHTDAGFAAAWGGFPVLTAAYAQTGRVTVAAVVVAGGACALSWAQRALSTPARHLRRRVATVHLQLVGNDGAVDHLDVRALLGPLERALRALSWASVALGVGLVIGRLD